MKKALLLVLTVALLSGMAVANAGDVIVSFPSDNTWYSTAANGSDFMGNNAGESAAMWILGDSISQSFVTGQSSVTSLTVDWTVVDYYGNNPGATYENDIYVNGLFVGYFLVPDCNFCESVVPVTGTVFFNPISGFGTYNISVVLAQTAALNAGSEWFTELNAAGAQATATLGTPEPGSIALFGSGVISLAGMLRRRLPR